MTADRHAQPGNAAASRHVGVRSVLHVDMDAFYVSVELRRRPELRGLPVVVGGTGGRGVVSAASYEARRFGVKSAMPSVTARRLCPDAVFLPPDMGHYLEVSAQLHEIFLSVTPLVEQISVDEAFLDVTGAERLMGDAVTIGHELRRRVKEQTDLTCSVGVASNKFIAKMASEWAKPVARPDGVTPGKGVFQVVAGDEVAFLSPLAVESLWGVGPSTLEKLRALGVRTIGELAHVPVEVLQLAVGESHGMHLHRLAHGIDERDVEIEREAKSIGNEETFAADVHSHEELRVHLVRLCDHVSRRLREVGVAAGTLMLKVKYSNFESITRSVTPAVPLTTGPSMVAALDDTLAGIVIGPGVRLLGVHAQKLTRDHSVADRLFVIDDGAQGVESAWAPAARAMDSITSKFGEGVIGPASVMSDKRDRRQRHFGPLSEDESAAGSPDRLGGE